MTDYRLNIYLYENERDETTTTTISCFADSIEAAIERANHYLKSWNRRGSIQIDLSVDTLLYNDTPSTIESPIMRDMRG